MAKEMLGLLVEGGNAKPGPATAPKLAQFKINMGQLFNDINEKTKEYKGMNVPIEIEIDTGTGSYKVRVGVPPVASLIKKEMGIKKFGLEKKQEAGEEEGEERDKKKAAAKEEKAGEKPKEKKEEKKIFGNLSIDQAIKIAKMKQDGMLAKSLKSALKEVVGACVSMPITVEDKTAKEVLRDIDAGAYDDKLK